MISAFATVVAVLAARLGIKARAVNLEAIVEQA